MLTFLLLLMHSAIAMDTDKIVSWCSEKQVAIVCALVLSDVPLEVLDDVVYRVLNTVKVLGRTKVHGHCT